MQAGLGADFGTAIPGMIRETSAGAVPASAPHSPAPAVPPVAAPTGAKFCSDCGAKLAP